MKIQITNFFNNHALPISNLKSGFGNGFHIKYNEHEYLFDVGGGIKQTNADKVMHNLNQLNIDINNIEKIIFSHGHKDHTAPLPKLLDTRKEEIEIIAHPDALEPKAAKILFFKINIGFPKLTSESQKKINFKLSKNPQKILENIQTTGEITNRPEKDGTAKKLIHKAEGIWSIDPIKDDLSLVIRTKTGLVLLCGCCHAGLLNTCSHITKQFNGEKIHTIIGGTHMSNFTQEELDHVINELKVTYDTPKLYLNHCTGDKTIAYLKEKLGEDIVKDCFVGTKLTFDM